MGQLDWRFTCSATLMLNSIHIISMRQDEIYSCILTRFHKAGTTRPVSYPCRKDTIQTSVCLLGKLISYRADQRCLRLIVFDVCGAYSLDTYPVD